MKKESVIEDLSDQKKKIKKVIKSRKRKSRVLNGSIYLGSILLAGGLSLLSTKALNRDPLSFDKQFQEYTVDFVDLEGNESQYIYQEPTKYINEECEDSIVVNIASKWKRDGGAFARTVESYTIKGNDLITKISNMSLSDINDDFINSIKAKKTNSDYQIKDFDVITEEELEAPAYVSTEFFHDGVLVNLELGPSDNDKDLRDFGILFALLDALLGTTLCINLVAEYNENKRMLEDNQFDLNRINYKIKSLTRRHKSNC